MVVLYVEDEEDDVFFLREAFRRARVGADLRASGDGREAIRYLSGEAPFDDRAQHPVPDLVLLDLNLPLLSGFEVLSWLRQNPMLSKLPVIVFSSSSFEDDLRKAYALGADGYLVKPSSGMDFNHVVTAVSNLLADRVKVLPAAPPEQVR